ncbi:MAG: hypothetical protein ACT4OF_14510, partial [Caulobacteraceae bacterium]
SFAATAPRSTAPYGLPLAVIVARFASTQTVSHMAHVYGPPAPSPATTLILPTTLQANPALAGGGAGGPY